MKCRWIGCNADELRGLFIKTTWRNTPNYWTPKYEIQNVLVQERSAGGRYDTGILSLFKTNLSQIQIWEYMRDFTEWTLWLSTAEVVLFKTSILISYCHFNPDKKKRVIALNYSWRLPHPNKKKSLPPLIIFYFVYFEKNELAFIGNRYKKHI